MARFHGDSASDSSRRRIAAVIPLPWVARRPRPYPQPSEDPDDYIVSTRAIIGVALFLVFFIGGSVWLMDKMHSNAKKEDCLMSGRKNCFPISTVTEK